MDFDIYLRFVIALILVLGLIAGLTWAARRFGFGGQLTPNAGKTPRLSVVEVRTLDSRRKLVLLRRDACEHLVLLGPNQDLYLEGGIPARGAATGETTDTEATENPSTTLPTTERRSS